MTVKQYFKTSFDDYVNSIKLDRRFLYVILVDILFYGILLGSFVLFFSMFFMTEFAQFYNGITSLPADFGGSAASDLGKQGWVLFLTFTLYLVFVTLFYAFFKGLIHKIIQEKKFKLKIITEYIKNGFLRFFSLNLFILLFSIIFFYSSFSIFRQEIFPIILLFVQIPFTLHFILVSHQTILNEKKFFAGLKKSFGVAIKKIHYFIIPYIVILIELFFVLIIMYFAAKLPSKIFTLISLILLLIFANWMKVYLHKIISRLF
jgi:hypothetical protein